MNSQEYFEQFCLNELYQKELARSNYHTASLILDKMSPATLRTREYKEWLKSVDFMIEYKYHKIMDTLDQIDETS